MINLPSPETWACQASEPAPRSAHSHCLSWVPISRPPASHNLCLLLPVSWSHMLTGALAPGHQQSPVPSTWGGQVPSLLVFFRSSSSHTLFPFEGLWPPSGMKGWMVGFKMRSTQLTSLMWHYISSPGDQLRHCYGQYILSAKQHALCLLIKSSVVVTLWLMFF